MQDLKLYRSVKHVHATPMLLGDAAYHTSNKIHGNIEAPGYLVVYNKDTEKEYISWSPKEEFEKGNVDLSGPLSYSIALEECLEGNNVHIAREGWNGKGMYVFLIDPYRNEQFEVDTYPDIVGELLPYLAMKTADNKIVPWLCSQTDMQAKDWYLV